MLSNHQKSLSSFSSSFFSISNTSNIYNLTISSSFYNIILQNSIHLILQPRNLLCACESNLIKIKRLHPQVPPRFELGLLDSKSSVITTTPWDRSKDRTLSTYSPFISAIKHHFPTHYILIHTLQLKTNASHIKLHTFSQHISFSY